MDLFEEIKNKICVLMIGKFGMLKIVMYVGY